MKSLDGGTLEIQNFPLRSFVLGDRTEFDDRTGTLYVDEREALDLVREDPNILFAELKVLSPGEAVRVCPVKDAFQIRKTPFDTAFPGVLGPVRSMANRTGTIKAISGCSLLVSGMKFGSHQDGVLDMDGVYRDYTLYGNMRHLLLVGHSKEDEGPSLQLKTNWSFRLAGMKLVDYLAKTLEGKVSRERSVYSTGPIPSDAVVGSAGLPPVLCVLLVQAQMDVPGYNTLVFGMDAGSILPTLLHPVDVLSGAITSGSFMPSSTKMSTYDYATHPMVTRLLAEHGRSVNFVGVVVSGLSVEMDRKIRSAELIATLAASVGAKGAVLIEEGYGNADVDFSEVFIALERVGVRTVGMTCESSGRDGTASPFAVMDSRLDAIVSTGNVSQKLRMPSMSVIGDIMAVERDHMPGGWPGSVAPDGHVEMENNYFCSCGVCGYSTKSCVYGENDASQTIRSECFTEPPVPACERAYGMLVAKMRERPYRSELPIEEIERVPKAPPIGVKNPTIAIVTTTGLVPKENPDGIPPNAATRWGAYSIEGKESLDPNDYLCLHAGYDIVEENANPDRYVPVDAMRALEREGRLLLYGRYFVTEGTETTAGEAMRMGREIAKELLAAKVDGVLFVTSWGTCTRCGSFMAREMERAKIPTALLANLYPIAESLGVHRVAPAMSAPFPLGDPAISRDVESKSRKKFVEKALMLLFEN